MHTDRYATVRRERGEDFGNDFGETSPAVDRTARNLIWHKDVADLKASAWEQVIAGQRLRYAKDFLKRKVDRSCGGRQLNCGRYVNRVSGVRCCASVHD